MNNKQQYINKSHQIDRLKMSLFLSSDIIEELDY